ncbi:MULTISPECIES: hypothetical protein [Kitasatospora]|uniref:hypothetical protein n=1 Tax=Kitasatospora TaxID=2063 RepID=UPI001E332D79|nr:MULTISPECIES: hypothetical protein [Kitasatospora]
MLPAVALLLSVVCGVLLAVVPVSTASAATGGGTVGTVVGGVPARVSAGDGFTAVFTVRSTSRYRILVDSLQLRVSAADDPSEPSDGVSVLWQDPGTGGWRSSDARAGTSWGLTLSPALAVEPRGSLTFRARITLSSELPGGAYAVESDGVADYRLVDEAGHDAGRLDARQRARAVFRYGVEAGPSASASVPNSPSSSPSASGAPSGGPSPSPSAPVGATVPPGGAALPSDPPSVSGTPSAATPSASRSRSGSPSPSPSDDDAAAVGDPDSSAPVALSAAGPALDSAAGPGAGAGAGAARSASATLLAIGLLSILAGLLLGASLLVQRHARL